MNYWRLSSIKFTGPSVQKGQSSGHGYRVVSYMYIKKVLEDRFKYTRPMARPILWSINKLQYN